MSSVEMLRAGRPVRVETQASLMTPPDHWFWRGPLTVEERVYFWDVVKRCNLVALEFMNPAIQGLVWHRGYPAIVYDHQVVQRISRQNWLASTKEQEGMLAVKQQEALQALLNFDAGLQSPYFVVK